MKFLVISSLLLFGCSQVIQNPTEPKSEIISSSSFSSSSINKSSSIFSSSSQIKISSSSIVKISTLIKNGTYIDLDSINTWILTNDSLYWTSTESEYTFRGKKKQTDSSLIFYYIQYNVNGVWEYTPVTSAEYILTQVNSNSFTFLTLEGTRTYIMQK